ncbi:MAG: hypothetical protein SF097_19240 [Acidobacteriota bacterium]|nr:hypothetical protein [Acidobacteriota bacterium]
MNASTATLEIAADLAIAIRTNALARRQSLDQYLREMIELDSIQAVETLGADVTEAKPTPNYAMLEAIRKVSERNKNRRYTSGEDTQRMLREARAGAMFGYEPRD